MRKKLFAILMSAMMMVTFMPAMAFADVIADTNDYENCILTDVTWAADYSTATATVKTKQANLDYKVIGTTTVDAVKTMSSKGVVTATATFGKNVMGDGREGFVSLGYDNDDEARAYFEKNQKTEVVTKSYIDLTGAKLVKDNKGTEITTMTSQAFLGLASTKNSTDNKYYFNSDEVLGGYVELTVPAGVEYKVGGVQQIKRYVKVSDINDYIDINIEVPAYEAYDAGSYVFPITWTDDRTEATAKAGGNADDEVVVFGTPEASKTVTIDGTTNLLQVAFTLDGKAVNASTGTFDAVKYNGAAHTVALKTKGVTVDEMKFYKDSVSAANEVKEIKNVGTYKVTFKAHLDKNANIKASDAVGFDVVVGQADGYIEFAQDEFVYGEGYAIPKTELLNVKGYAAADKAVLDKFIEKYVTVSGIIAKQGTNALSITADETTALSDATLAKDAEMLAFLSNYDLKAGKTVSKLTVVAAKDNKITVSTKTINAKKAKKVVKTINASATTGTLTFAKVSGNKKITVAENGKVTVKKGLKKGKTYTLKVKVSVAGDRTYAAATKTATIKVKVK